MGYVGNAQNVVQGPKQLSGCQEDKDGAAIRSMPFV